MFAATQEPSPTRGAVPSAAAARPVQALAAVADRVPAGSAAARPAAQAVSPAHPAAGPRRFVIRGTTKDGRSFRPSDWSERLASAMSCFRPAGGVGGIGAFIGYSPYCVPTVVDSTRCVIVSEALRGIEPMAWDFVMNFARDNDLRLDELFAAASDRT